LAWTACRTFLAINGEWISASEDERFDFVISAATGEAELDAIAARLRCWGRRDQFAGRGIVGPGRYEELGPYGQAGGGDKGG